jgi:hypothetical protein
MSGRRIHLTQMLAIGNVSHIPFLVRFDAGWRRHIRFCVLWYPLSDRRQLRSYRPVFTRLLSGASRAIAGRAGGSGEYQDTWRAPVHNCDTPRSHFIHFGGRPLRTNSTERRRDNHSGGFGDVRTIGMLQPDIYWLRARCAWSIASSEPVGEMTLSTHSCQWREAAFGCSNGLRRACATRGMLNLGSEVQNECRLVIAPG